MRHSATKPAIAVARLAVGGLAEQSAWLLFTCEWLAHSYLWHEDLHDRGVFSID